MRILEPMDNFWDELGNLSAESEMEYHLAGWREQFRHLADLHTLEKLLLPVERETVRHIPCPFRNGCGECLHLSVEKEDGTSRFFGICQEERIPPVELDAAGLRAMRFNYRLFHERVAGALPILPDVRPTNAPQTWLLGNLHFGTGKRRRIYLSYRMPGHMIECCSFLMAVENEPCIVLSPHYRRISDRIKLVLNALPVIFLPVQEVVGIDFHCRPYPIEPRHPALAEYADAETVDSLGARDFPVPTGIGWKDIHLHFLDMHTLTCRVGTSQATFNYADWGMKHARTGKPDHSWLLLALLAESGGYFFPKWEGSQVAADDRKKKSRLAAALRKIFRLESDPFTFDADRKAYLARFRIFPETRSSQYHRRLRG